VGVFYLKTFGPRGAGERKGKRRKGARRLARSAGSLRATGRFVPRFASLMCSAALQGDNECIPFLHPQRAYSGVTDHRVWHSPNTARPELEAFTGYRICCVGGHLKYREYICVPAVLHLQHPVKAYIQASELTLKTVTTGRSFWRNRPKPRVFFTGNRKPVESYQ